MKTKKAKKTVVKEVKVKKTNARLKLAEVEQETARIKRSQVIWAKIITFLYIVTPIVDKNWDSIVLGVKWLFGLL